MNLLKATGTIGGLTMVSRILGFAREMVFARVMGASAAAEVFIWAFQLPNLLRRLLGEGAFSQGFVPLFARRIGKDGDLEDARRFAEEVQAVFLPVLILITGLFIIAMPAVVIAVASERWTSDPEKFGFTVFLTQITFPYLIFISMVSLFSGILNSLSRFVAAAFAPALLNVALLAALLLVPDGGTRTATAMAWAVLVGGVLQLGLCIVATHRAGIKLRLRPPRMTPRVKELLILILPATIGAGGYYISQLFYAYFATRLPEGSFVYLEPGRPVEPAAAGFGRFRDRHRHPARDQPPYRPQRGYSRPPTIQGRATELAMLLTIPATIALAVAAGPIMTVLVRRRAVYRGGCRDLGAGPVDPRHRPCRLM